MRYEWNQHGKVYELHEVSDNNTGKVMTLSTRWWDSYYPLGRLRRVKNKRSCKKFALERFEHGSWTYITLLVMKLDEAKEVAKTILCAGGGDA